MAEVLEIKANGDIFWSRQQLLTLTAPLELHEFPFEYVVSSQAS
jgi:hypothetical protein